MKVYVAAKFCEKERVREVHKLLKKSGYEIIHDWTQNLASYPFEQNPIYTTKCANEDIQAVLNSEIFILLTNDEPSTGASSELGAAIATFLMFKKIKIYVVGPHFNTNFCFYHSAVTKMSTIEEVICDMNNFKLSISGNKYKEI